ncbi:MAG: hypothetical protein ACRD0U_16510 [Acidimicrobiales bacterium]
MHAIQRFTDAASRWIEFDSLGAGSPNAYITELNAGVPTEAATYNRCVDLTAGPEVAEYSDHRAVHANRTILAAQEWEWLRSPSMWWFPGAIYPRNESTARLTGPRLPGS